VRIVFDIDGSLCHCSSPFFKKISKKLAKTRIPWPVVYLGLLLVKQKVDQEMVEIINSPENTVRINSIRPKEVENLTKRFLKQNGVAFAEAVECFGPNGSEQKIINALEMRADLVVDDDDEVLKMASRYGITGCEPYLFKRLYKSGAIK
jgi:predicted nucleic acid-binding protein